MKYTTQQFVMMSGVAIILLMGLFPPWIYVDENKVSHAMGYAPIWNPPTVNQDHSLEVLGFKLQVNVLSQAANAIDLLRLAIQISMLAAVIGCATMLLKQPSSKATRIRVQK